jgi:hypothetical protein
MGLDQKGSPVFCVKAGRNGQWNVLEEGFEKPLAMFDDRNDAMKYARDLADTKEGATVRVEDESSARGEGKDMRGEGPGEVPQDRSAAGAQQEGMAKPGKPGSGSPRDI